MLTLNDIINVSFRKSSFSGYRPEDVDEFIDEVKESYDLLIKKNIEQKESNEALTAENTRLEKAVDDLQKKLDELNVRVEGYRRDEDEIKNALISAQKLGDASIREARHKAEIILKDANLKAERIVSTAQMEIMEQKEDLDRLKQLVSDFRSNLLDMYKEHLTLINSLPSKKSLASMTPAVAAMQNEEPAAKKEEPSEEEEGTLSAAEQAQLFQQQQMMRVAERAAEASRQAAEQQEQEEADAPGEEGQPTQEVKKVVIPVDDVDAQETKSFVIGGEKNAEPQKEESHAEDEIEDSQEARDLRYDVLKFGDDYDIADDLDSPVGIFKRNKKSK